MKKIQTLSAMDAQRMTSLEIAEVTGKPHNDVLKAIRKMESAWTQVTQGQCLPGCYGAHTALLLSLEDRVSLHRHEVQRRGARQVGDPMGRTGAGAGNKRSAPISSGLRRAQK